MHPLVRDLYKRVTLVGRDYPKGIDYVRKTWKKALRNPHNCPSCVPLSDPHSPKCEREIRRAVAKGRNMVREMEGIIQFKKYRAMKHRYGKSNEEGEDQELSDAMRQLVHKHNETNP